MPVQNQQVFRAVLGHGGARFHHQSNISVRSERDCAFKRHVQRGHTQRASRQDEAVHAFGNRVADDVGGENIRARRQVRAVLLHAALRQNDQRILFQLRRDFRLRQVDKIAAGQHGVSCQAPSRACTCCRMSAMRMRCPFSSMDRNAA